MHLDSQYGEAVAGIALLLTFSFFFLALPLIWVFSYHCIPAQSTQRWATYFLKATYFSPCISECLPTLSVCFVVPAAVPSSQFWAFYIWYQSTCGSIITVRKEGGWCGGTVITRNYIQVRVCEYRAGFINNSKVLIQHVFFFLFP